MFVNSPYTLRLVSTSPFIKPGLPYNIQVWSVLPISRSARGGLTTD